MSGICGYVGNASPAVLDGMLAAIDYRGESTDTLHGTGFGLAYRWWKDRPGKAGSPLGPPFPDIVIACGRITVPYIRALKRAAASSVVCPFSSWTSLPVRAS